MIPVDFDALKASVCGTISPRVYVWDDNGRDAHNIYFQQRDLGKKQLFFFVNISRDTSL